MKEQSEVLTPKEVATMTNRTLTTVRRWMYDGWLEYSKDPLSRRVTITKAAVDKLLTEGPPQQSDN